MIVAQTKIGAQPNLMRTNQHSKFTWGMQSLDPLSWFGWLFLVSLVAGLAERRVPSLTDREQVALGKIERKYHNIMKTEVTRIFSTLRECLAEADSRIERCLSRALLEAETKKHNHRLTFIQYYLSRISFTCLKIEITIGIDKTLLADEKKRESFPPKVLDLLRVWKLCRSITDDTYLAAKVQEIMLNEYKKRAN